MNDFNRSTLASACRLSALFQPIAYGFIRVSESGWLIRSGFMSAEDKLILHRLRAFRMERPGFSNLFIEKTQFLFEFPSKFLVLSLQIKLFFRRNGLFCILFNLCHNDPLRIPFATLSTFTLMTSKGRNFISNTPMKGAFENE